jgi:hypothetical protein
MQYDGEWRGIKYHYLDWWLKPQGCGWLYRFTFELKRGQYKVYWQSRLHNRIFRLTSTHINLMGLVVSWR